MKLELKHICGYLPHGLRMKGDDGSIARLTLDFGCSIGNYGLELVLRTGKAKPILRPMPDLYKEIDGVVPIFEAGKHFESTGSLFVEEGVYSYGWNSRICDDWQGYEIGWRYNEGWFGIYYDEYDSENQDRNFTGDILPFKREVLDYLFEHHFDIYDLIGNNLAIDINTIK